MAGADPNLQSDTDGQTALFATLNTQWAPKSNYPQPRAQDTQRTEYDQLVEVLLRAGADPNLRLNTHLWYFEYGLTKIGTDLAGATPFWRAAYAQDVEMMRLAGGPRCRPEHPDVAGRRSACGSGGSRTGASRRIPGCRGSRKDAFNAFPIHVAAGGGYTGLGSFSIRNMPGTPSCPPSKYLDRRARAST